MTAAPAEVIELRQPVLPAEEGDEYARTVSALYRWGGSMAVQDIIEVGYAKITEQLAHADFYTAVLENLKTDQEFRSVLDTETDQEFEIRNGKTVAADGRPIVELVKAGLEASKAAAETDEQMETQVIRDEGDDITAQVVEELLPGEMYTVVSMDPKEGLLDARLRKFLESLGYREGLAFVQRYYKHPTKNIVQAGSYSVERSDHDAWRRIQARHGAIVPEGTSSDHWIRYGFKMTVTPGEAESFGKKLRQEYYEEIGLPYERISVAEFLKQYKPIVDNYFERYMKPLAHAIYTGQNNDVMSGLADAVQRTSAIESLKPDVREELLKVANMQAFSRKSGSVMKNLIRYALVEKLREALVAHISGSAAPELGSLKMGYADAHEELAEAIQGGVEAGRTYGGCDSIEPQGAYGGKTETCVEIKNGQIVRCPSCKRMVAAIVPKGEETVYCRNGKCELAHPSLKRAHKHDHKPETPQKPALTLIVGGLALSKT